MTIHHARKPVEVHNVGFLRLYREDLEKIARVIQDECGNLNIDFHDENQTSGNEPGDFAAIADHLPEKLSHITMTGRRDEVVIKVELGDPGHTPSSVAVTSPDNSARGAAHAIMVICEDRRTKLASFIGSVDSPRSELAKMGLILGIIGVVTAISAYLVNTFGDSPVVAVAITIVLILVFSLYPISESQSKTVIINAPRALRPSHWQRHKITYISNAITLLSGGIIEPFRVTTCRVG